MIRFILKHTVKDAASGAVKVRHETIDAHVPELEDKLRRGGMGPEGFDITELVGAETKWSSDDPDWHSKSKYP